MDYYDSIAQGYEELHREEQLKKIKIIMPDVTAYIRNSLNIPTRSLKSGSQLKILDVGCGTGIFYESEELGKAGLACDSLIGIDPSEKLIDIAKNKKNGTYLVAPAENLPFKDGEFDMIISLTAIQNFTDVKNGFIEMKRVGKPDAIFILTFLKKSAKRKLIEELISQMFNVQKRIEEDKDVVFICQQHC